MRHLVAFVAGATVGTCVAIVAAVVGVAFEMVDTCVVAAAAAAVVVVVVVAAAAAVVVVVENPFPGCSS